MFYKGEGGYIGKSMSVRANKAYKEGERPLYKWTKKEILQEVEDLQLENIPMDIFKKLNLENLKTHALKYSSWHHTGNFYNETNFYKVDEYYLSKLTRERILEILEKQKANRRKTTPEERERVKAEKEKRQQEKAAREEKEKLFKYQGHYKTINGFLKGLELGRIDIEELKKIRQEKITKRRKELRELWERQLPENHENWKRINDDDFIDFYIK